MDLFSRESRNETSANVRGPRSSRSSTRGLNNQPSGEPPEHVHSIQTSSNPHCKGAAIACAFENFPAAFDKSLSDPSISCVHFRPSFGGLGARPRCFDRSRIFVRSHMTIPSTRTRRDMETARRTRSGRRDLGRRPRAAGPAAQPAHALARVYPREWEATVSGSRRAPVAPGRQRIAHRAPDSAAQQSSRFV